MGKDAPFFSLRLFFSLFSLLFLTGARYETRNFSVENAPTAQWAKKFCETAERCRFDLAVLWLAEPLPDWSEKCPIYVTAGDELGAGGATTFVFDNGEVYGWEMNVQGSAQRIIDSVLPHEITHTIWATHFRQPVPRWLDEGAATAVECPSEKENYRRLVRYFLQEDVKKCLPFNRMVEIKDYPADPIPFYAQGFSVTEFLIQWGEQQNSDGKRRLVRFAETGIRSGDWNAALQQCYDITNLGELQQKHWLSWVESNAVEPTVPLAVKKMPDSATTLSVEPTERTQTFSSVYNRNAALLPVRMEDAARVDEPVLTDAASFSVIR